MRPAAHPSRAARPTARDVGASRTRSVRVGDIRLQSGRSVARRGAATATGGRAGTARVPGRQRHSPAPLIVVAAVVAVLVVAVLLLRSSSLFTVENVSVSGVEHLTTEEMMALVDVPEGTTLLQVDTEAVEQRLMKDAWIEKADVKVAFPHTLKVDVTERQIHAIVEVPTKDGSSTTSWAIASDGMWLMPIPDQNSEAGQKTSQRIYDDAQNVLHITDVPYGTDPQIGAFCDDANVNNALSIVVSLTTDLSGQVRSVAATETDSTTVTLDSGVEIVFGSAEDIREKERVVLAIMEQHEGSLAYINVTNPKSPTWRAL